MPLKKIVFTILIVLVCISLFTFKKKVYDNPDRLCDLSERFDEPSTMFYIILERIFKLSEDISYNQKFMKYLNDNKKPHLYDRYARMLGVLGEDKAIPILKDVFIRYQNNRNYEAKLHYIIKSMGMIGSVESIDFLEEEMDKQRNMKSQVSGSTIACALYLITGNSEYYFVNVFGKRQKLHLSDRLIEARTIIVRSKDRKRTYDEILTLDQVYRPGPVLFIEKVEKEDEKRDNPMGTKGGRPSEKQ